MWPIYGGYHGFNSSNRPDQSPRSLGPCVVFFRTKISKKIDIIELWAVGIVCISTKIKCCCVCLITELLYTVIMVVVGTFISVYLSIHTDSAPAEHFQVYHWCWDPKANLYHDASPSSMKWFKVWFDTSLNHWSGDQNPQLFAVYRGYQLKMDYKKSNIRIPLHEAAIYGIPAGFSFGSHCSLSKKNPFCKSLWSWLKTSSPSMIQTSQVLQIWWEMVPWWQIHLASNCSRCWMCTSAADVSTLRVGRSWTCSR